MYFRPQCVLTCDLSAYVCIKLGPAWFLVLQSQPGQSLLLEHSYSDSSNLIGQFEVSYFHSDTVEGTTCSALALRAWLFYM